MPSFEQSDTRVGMHVPDPVPDSHDIAQLRAVLSEPGRGPSLAADATRSYFGDLQRDRGGAHVPQWLTGTVEHLYRTAFEATHACAESEIERLFLASLVLGYAFRDPFRFVLTQPFRDAPNQVTVVSERYQALHYVEHMLAAQERGTSIGDVVDGLEADGELDRDDCTWLHAMGVLGPLYREAFHLTPQACFPALRHNGRALRVDALVWVPMRHDVRIVIECDGYAWHGNRVSFTADRQRDRLLQSHGFRVIRFSGAEIYADPARASEELRHELERIAATWPPLPTEMPPRLADEVVAARRRAGTKASHHPDRPFGVPQ